MTWLNLISKWSFRLKITNENAADKILTVGLVTKGKGKVRAGTKFHLEEGLD